MEMELTQMEVRSQQKRKQNSREVPMRRYISVPTMHQRQTGDIISDIMLRNL